MREISFLSIEKTAYGNSYGHNQKKEVEFLVVIKKKIIQNFLHFKDVTWLCKISRKALKYLDC